MKNSEWLYECVDTAQYLYGIYPLEVLNALYRLKADDNLKADEVNDFLYETASGYILVDEDVEAFRKLGYGTKILRPVLYSDDTIKILKQMGEEKDPTELLHIDEMKQIELVERQGIRPFFIPGEKQMDFFLEQGYFPNSELKSLYKFFKGRVFEEDIFDAYLYASSYNDVYNYLLEVAELKEPQDFDEFSSYMDAILKAYNSMKQRELRGYSPNELSKLAHVNDNSDVMERLQREFAAMGVKPKEPEVKKVKVGRNDPCPCGSGKKYKHCCLRKTMA
ncbi:MAG: YecA family protein [Erysipelotrichaceae bacterium]